MKVNKLETSLSVDWILLIKVLCLTVAEFQYPPASPMAIQLPYESNLQTNINRYWGRRQQNCEYM